MYELAICFIDIILGPMIRISESAQNYFQHLISQQDEEGLGLRISVSMPGTPNAACDLQFCPEGTQAENDHSLELDGLNFFVDRQSASWLSDAEIDFEEEATGGQLTIRAPGIKGSAPDKDACCNSVAVARDAAWPM